MFTRNYLIFLAISTLLLVYFYFVQYFFTINIYDTYYMVSYFFPVLLVLIIGTIIYIFKLRKQKQNN
jgi:uncharacterized membrane protein YqjE